MTRDEALGRLHEITEGIDQTEDEPGDGWWEVSTGAEFGAQKLCELEDLITDLTAKE